MYACICGPGVTAAIPIETGDGVHTAGLQGLTKDVSGFFPLVLDACHWPVLHLLPSPAVAICQYSE